ncbi:hypothetical protein EC950183_4919, partial [Escherichia coli 95.0183]|jgi:hypothetical protein
MIGF